MLSEKQKQHYKRLSESMKGNKNGLGYRLYIKTKKDVTRLMELVTPYMLKCFYYKIKVPQISLPLWKTDRTKKKCQVLSCQKVAPKERIVCGGHRHSDLQPKENPAVK